MKNDDAKTDNRGRVPGKQMIWQQPGGTGLVMYRHCDNTYTLECCGILVLPRGPFCKICNYTWAEFDVLEEHK